jgi:ABC-type transport system involved in cytochrome c biogenesis ATPase subunit
MTAPHRASGCRMIRTVDVRNFRCFEHLRIERCGRINVIVGDNAAGKTSLLEAIFLALGVNPEIGVRYRQQRGLDGAFSGPPIKIEEALWKNLFFASNWQRQIQIELAGDGPESRSVTVYRGRSQLTIPLELTDREEETRTTPIVFDWKDFEGNHHVRSPKISPKGLEIEGSDENLPDFFYFPASQTIGSSENAGRFSEIRRAGRGPAFVKLLTREYKWIRDLDIEVVAGSPIIFAKTSNSREMLPLAYISGGINKIVNVMLAIAATDRSIVLVDEIENGIFHAHQGAFCRAILALTRNYDGQMFATTHSYEWLKALVQAADDKIDDIALWRLEWSENRTPVLFQFGGNTLRDAIKHGAEARGG